MTATRSFVYNDYQTNLSFKVQIFGDGDRNVIIFPGGPGINSNYLISLAGNE